MEGFPIVLSVMKVYLFDERGQMLNGFSIDHDGRGTLQDLLDRVVVEVGHDGRA